MNNDLILAQILIEIKKQFLRGTDVAVVLDKAIDLALLQEQELTVHRFAEAGREMVSTLETPATETLKIAIGNNGAEIIRPEFGRKK